MVGNVALVIVGLAGLFFGGDSLVRGAARLATSFGVSALVIGLTVVAFGTSSPELLVNVSAALQDSSDLALGNIVGSNIANIGLILGISSLIYPISVKWSLIRREIPILIAISLVMYILALDGTIQQVEGVLLFLGFITFSGFSYWMAQRERENISEELDEFEEKEHLTPPGPHNRTKEVGRIALGVVLLVVGSQAMVSGATAIAREFNVSELVIGATIVAFGTSLPELAASIVATLRKENDIALGNVIGSNVANILLILGTTSAVSAIPVAPSMLRADIVIMLAFTILLFPLAFDRRLTRIEGGLFLAAYLGYIIWSFLQ